VQPAEALSDQSAAAEEAGGSGVQPVEALSEQSAAAGGAGGSGVPPAEGLLVVFRQAGHLQFLDTMTTLQQSVCRTGKVEARALGSLAGGVVAAWGVQAAAAAAAGQRAAPAGDAGGGAAAWLAALPGTAASKGVQLTSQRL
jgi:hypothetical protein